MCDAPLATVLFNAFLKKISDCTTVCEMDAVFHVYCSILMCAQVFHHFLMFLLLKAGTYAFIFHLYGAFNMHPRVLILSETKHFYSEVMITPTSLEIHTDTSTW